MKEIIQKGKIYTKKSLSTQYEIQNNGVQRISKTFLLNFS